MTVLPGAFYGVDYVIGAIINFCLLLLLIYWFLKLYYPSILPSKSIITSVETPTTKQTLPNHQQISSQPPPSPNASSTPNEHSLEVEMYKINVQNKQKSTKTQSIAAPNIPIVTKRLSILVLLFFTIMLWIETILDINTRWTETECIILTFTWMFEWSSRTMLYTYYLYRTRNVFIGTPFEMNEIFYKIMVCLSYSSYQ